MTGRLLLGWSRAIRVRGLIGAVMLALGSTCGTALAQITVTENPAASVMGSQLFGCGGFTFVSASLEAYGRQVGTYALGTTGNNYGLSRPGIVMSTGYASMGATGPNTQNGMSNLGWAQANAAQSAMLAAVSGTANYYNCAQLTVTFNNPNSVATPLVFDLTFGSDEYPEYVGSGFIDSFGIFLNGAAAIHNIAYVAGKPVNISHPDMGVRVETELDGVLINKTNNIAVCTVTGTANPGLNTLVFIIADRSDPFFDSVAYISSIRPTCPPIGFSQQPQSVTANDGQTVALSCLATGQGPFKYQWFRACGGRDPAPITGGVGLSGWNTPTLTVGPMGQGVSCDCSYYCEVTDGCCNRKSTNTVSIFWPTPTAIVKHPKNVSVTPGSSASFSVTTTGSQPMSYQWYKICPPKVGAYQTVVNGGRFSGATTSTLTIDPVSPSDCLCSFYCVVRGPCYDVVSKTAVLSCGCTTPPPNMVLWLPFDELSGTTALNLAGGNNGTYVGIPAVGSQGKVSRSLCMDGGSAVDVQAYSNINIGTGDFSIDAWISPFAQPGVPQMIVDKRSFSVAFSPFRGYALYLSSTGVLSLELSDGVGPPSTYSGGAAMPMNTWTHVAATVKRNSTTGVKLYVNGVAVPVGAPSTTTQNLTIGTSQLLRIGAKAVSPISSLEQQFYGCIDEVEIFSRVLTPEEVRRVALADYLGKCRPVVNPWGTFASCNTFNFVNAAVTISNPSSEPIVGEIDMQPDFSGTASTPVWFTTDPPSPVTILPGESKVVTVTMPRPADADEGAVSSYQLCVLGRDGSATCATGQLVFRTDFCVQGGDTTTVSGFDQFDVGGVVLANSTDAPRQIEVRMRVLDEAGEADAGAISLNGLEPGVPWTMALTVPARGEVALPIHGRFRLAEPLHYYNILIEADTDGDGDFEPLRSIPLIQQFASGCPTEFSDNFESSVVGSACGVTSWQPWVGIPSGCGTVVDSHSFGSGKSLRISRFASSPAGAADDAVYVTDIGSGAWTVRAMILVPSGAQGNGSVVLMNSYPENLNWSTDIDIDADSGVVRDFGNPGGVQVPLLRDEWAEIRVEVDLQADTVSAFYNNQQFINARSWSEGDSGGGQKRIQAVDFFAGDGAAAITEMYVDDFAIVANCDSAPTCPADFNGDAVVDDADFIQFVLGYDLLDCADPAMPAGCAADLNRDGLVNDADFPQFLAAYNALVCP